MDSLFLNPYVSVIEMDDVIYIKSFKEYSFGVQKRDAFEYLFSKEEFTVVELLNYFSSDEISDLKKSRLLLNNSDLIPETDSLLSRQRGLFSIISANYRFFENRIKSMEILILGAGALGTHVLWGLITMGVQKITVVDYDIVEESNLNRQLFYGFNDIGCKKIEVLKKRVNDRYPGINITFRDEKINSEEMLTSIVNHDFVFKAFDTPKEGTEWVNTVCVKKKIPYISGGFLNEMGVVGPVYVPGMTPCYACNGYYDGKRYNKLSPTFSPIVTNVAAKIMLVFLDIALEKYDKLSQYYFFDLHTGKWKEKNYETKEKCSVCGKEEHYDIFSFKNIIKYLIIVIVGCGISFVANHFQIYVLNYLYIIILALISSKKITYAGYIFNCSIILVTINTVSFLLSGNISLLGDSEGLIMYIQGGSLIIVTICIMITLISIVWYTLANMLNTAERIIKNVICTKYNEKV